MISLYARIKSDDRFEALSISSIFLFRAHKKKNAQRKSINMRWLIYEWCFFCVRSSLQIGENLFSTFLRKGEGDASELWRLLRIFTRLWMSDCLNGTLKSEKFPLKADTIPFENENFMLSQDWIKKKQKFVQSFSLLPRKPFPITSFDMKIDLAFSGFTSWFLLLRKHVSRPIYMFARLATQNQ